MNKRVFGMAPGGRMSLDRAASKRMTRWMSQQQRTAQNGKEKPTQPVKTVNECVCERTSVPTESVCNGENGCCPIDFDAIERKLKAQAEARNHG